MSGTGGKLTCVVGGQYGSEGKGAITAWLGARSEHEQVIGVRVAGPNAGHTVIGPDDWRVADAKQREWKLRSVPVLAVSNPRSRLVIAAGSEVDLTVLLAELTELDQAGYRASERLMVDSQATWLTQDHIDTELLADLTLRLGSTAKGIGAARAARIMREAETVESAGTIRGTNTSGFLLTALEQGAEVIIEGTQGYGLGLHAGEYPYCTSSDCRAIDFMAMAGLSPWDPDINQVEGWVVLRTRPIRVAGNSGRLKDERTWEGLGLAQERTTVTNKVRRVGEWDAELAYDAVNANGGRNAKVAITMLDQMFPQVAGATKYDELTVEAMEWVRKREEEIEARVWAVGTSPSTVVEIPQ